MNRATVAEFTTTGRDWPSLNGSRRSPYAYQALVNDWHARAVLAARLARVATVDAPVTITATVHRTTAAKSDATNVLPAIKACVDAAVEVGVIPDDHDGIVTRTVIEPGPPVLAGPKRLPVRAITIRVEAS